MNSFFEQENGQAGLTAEKHVWHDYYHAFDYFSHGIVRKVCYPRIFLHPGGSAKALVLIHGLTDSPFAVAAIGEYFHRQLGYDVYMPLLHCHGLKKPDGMFGVQLREWKKNVRFAIDAATDKSTKISIGGFSTGGALAFNSGCNMDAVNGELYLFSPAFGLYGCGLPYFGKFIEFLLRTPLIRIYNPVRSLVGANPYRYRLVPLNSARELVVLMRENDRLIREFSGDKLLERRIHCVCSGADRVVRIESVNALEKIVEKGDFISWVIPKAARVKHASIVLNHPVYASTIEGGKKQRVIERANPFFDEMMERVDRFEKQSTDT